MDASKKILKYFNKLIQERKLSTCDKVKKMGSRQLTLCRKNAGFRKEREDFLEKTEDNDRVDKRW